MALNWYIAVAWQGNLHVRCIYTSWGRASLNKQLCQRQSVWSSLKHKAPARQRKKNPFSVSDFACIASLCHTHTHFSTHTHSRTHSLISRIALWLIHLIIFLISLDKQTPKSEVQHDNKNMTLFAQFSNRYHRYTLLRAITSRSRTLHCSREVTAAIMGLSRREKTRWKKVVWQCSYCTLQDVKSWSRTRT